MKLLFRYLMDDRAIVSMTQLRLEVTMLSRTELINKLRSRENWQVLKAVEELRVRGWLTDGSLRTIGLCQAELQGADLMKADLIQVDFHQAHLEYADLSMADLRCARFTRANLHGANFSNAKLTDADFYKANLREARHLTEGQLATVNRLWGATMPDGEPYDGRHHLAGDLAFARWAGVNLDDQDGMAMFYGVPLEKYRDGQEHAPSKRPATVA
jgi:hypothetical protein